MASTRSTGFCSSCASIPVARGPAQQYTQSTTPLVKYQKHCANGLLDMSKASSVGCDLCDKFWACLTPQEQVGVKSYCQSHDVEDKATYYSIEKAEEAGQFRLTFLWPSFAKSVASSSVIAGRLRKTFKIIPAKPFNSEKVINPLSYRAQNSADYCAVEPCNLTSMPTSQSTWSPAEIKLAKIWIDCCVEGHACSRNALAPYAPSRLISVGTCENPSARLCERSDIVTQARYTTLSYCWGSSSSLTLKGANLEDMKQAIPYEALPKTIQHAIITSRDLNVSYLWVDSLCIIQDSAEDWQRECTAMGDIYSGSYCNIAATGARDNQEGYIFDRDPASILSTRIQLPPPVEPYSNGNLTQLAYIADMPPGTYSVVYDEDVWSLDIMDSPSLQRAWVVQERLMAPRNLHFSKRQVAFECRSWIACETFPGGFPDNLVSMRSWKERCSVRTQIHKGEREPYTIDLMRAASSFLVIEYSKGQLTRPQDKLAGIFGIASDIGKVIGSSYLAGLWTDLLPEQLLWRVEASVEDLKARPTIYQAPTWSWAATNNPVREVFASGTFQPSFCFLISRVTVEAETYDMVIDQGQARLRLCGRLLNALLISRDAPHHSNRDLFNMQTPEFDNTYIAVLPDHQLSAGHYICLPVLASSDGPNHPILIDGLLLERNQGKGTLSRIGRFEVKANLSVLTSQFMEDIDKVRQIAYGSTLQDSLWHPDNIEIEIE